MMGKYDDRSYEVGKGKPPRQHQFQKGRSGNPRGPRHKKKIAEATLAILVYEAANELITVQLRGREMRIPKKQAIVLGIMNDALQGSPAQRLKAFKALQEVGAFEPHVQDDRLTREIQEEDIKAFINRLTKEALDLEPGLPPSRHMLANAAEEAS